MDWTTTGLKMGLVKPCTKPCKSPKFKKVMVRLAAIEWEEIKIN